MQLCRAAALLLPLGLPLWPAEDATAAFDVQQAIERSQGRYGDSTDTVIVSSTSTLRWRSERGWLQVDLPWLRMHHAGGSAALPESGSAGRQGQVSGWGDAWLKAGWTVLEADRGLGMDAVLRYKSATGSAAAGLGTGAADWAVQLDLTWAAGPVTLFGELGHRWTGQTAGVPSRHDPWYGEMGAQLVVMPGVDLGLFHDARERIGRLGSLRETTLFAAWRLGDQRLQVHATQGRGAASVGHALGLTWRLRWP